MCLLMIHHDHVNRLWCQDKGPFAVTVVVLHNNYMYLFAVEGLS